MLGCELRSPICKCHSALGRANVSTSLARPCRASFQNGELLASLKYRKGEIPGSTRPGWLLLPASITLCVSNPLGPQSLLDYPKVFPVPAARRQKARQCNCCTPPAVCPSQLCTARAAQLAPVGSQGHPAVPCSRRAGCWQPCLHLEEATLIQPTQLLHSKASAPRPLQQWLQHPCQKLPLLFVSGRREDNGGGGGSRRRRCFFVFPLKLTHQIFLEKSGGQSTDRAEIPLQQPRAVAENCSGLVSFHPVPSQKISHALSPSDRFPMRSPLKKLGWDEGFN